LYFDTTADQMRVYTGITWVAAGSAVNGTAERNVYTATGGQTTFASTYDVGFVDVYLNGVKLTVSTDFTATSGTDIVLTSGATAGDIVDIVAYGAFEIANTFTQAQADARFLRVTNNLSDLDNAATARQNLGVEIGVDVEAFDATILKDADIGVTVQGYDATILIDADIGVTVQGYDANLPAWPASVDATEVGYLDGVTSAIQTQLNALQAGFTTNVITTSTTATKNNHYYLNGATITLTLPATPSVGDEVRLSEVAGNVDCIIARNGSNIMSVADNLTVDLAYAVIYLRYVDATIGWAFS